MENLTDVTNATISLASLADGKDTNDVLTWDGAAWVSQAPTAGNTLIDPLNPLKTATFRLTDLTAGGRNIYLSDANMLLPAQFASNTNLLTGITTLSSIIVDGGGSGEKNTAYGKGACANLTVGDSNTGVGYQSLNTVTEGYANTSVGVSSMFGLTSGYENIAIGNLSLYSITSGSNNTAIGVGACTSTIDGTLNTCVGYSSGSGITSGIGNVCVGSNTGGITTGNYNVIIGNGSIASNGARTNCIAIGYNLSASINNACFIKNIRGVTTNNANGVSVLIDSAGQLGTVSSSLRFKENVVDQNIADAIYQLRPVTFTYKTDQTNKTQYGLIAEEVAEHIPGIVVYDDTDQPETVQYHLLPSMLIEVIKKQKTQIDALTERVSALEAM